MNMILRRYTFKLYLNAAQEKALREQLLMMGQLWNALLQRREDVYRREGRTLGKREQYKEITQLRAECPEWAALSVAAARGVADRMDKAFKAFFQRAKKGAGAQSGYPRYKRADRWSSISFTEACGSGWNIARANTYKPRSSKPAGGWFVHVKGVPGHMKARGRLPVEPLDWRTGEILWRDGAWWLSVAVEMPCRRKAGQERITIKFDLIDEFARVERADGESLAGSKERITPSSPQLKSCSPPDTPELRGNENSVSATPVLISPPDTPELRGNENYLHRLTVYQAPPDTPELRGDENNLRVRDREGRPPDTPELRGDENWSGDHNPVPQPPDTPELRGDENATQVAASDCDRRYRKFSWRWKREKKRLARKHAYIARQRKYTQHCWTTAIVKRAGDLTVLSPPIGESTVSPRGNEKNWGACVSAVSSLNRYILDQAPAQAIMMLAYKAQEAGIRFDALTIEPITVGRDLVAAGKTVRRLKRDTRKEAA